MPGMSHSPSPSRLPTPPSLVEGPNHRFLIFDAPNNENLPLYIAEWKKFNIHDVVRACDPTYDIEPLHSEGITIHEMPFADGGAPSDEVVHKWLHLLQDTHKDVVKETIGVHCIAGLGRAPVLVAIALIESGMDALEAEQLIREKRKGAFNQKQLQYLRNYKRSPKKRNSFMGKLFRGFGHKEPAV